MRRRPTQIVQFILAIVGSVNSDVPNYTRLNVTLFKLFMDVKNDQVKVECKNVRKAAYKSLSFYEASFDPNSAVAPNQTFSLLIHPDIVTK